MTNAASSTTNTTASVLCLLALSALQPFGASALAATAPVNVPASQTLDLTNPNSPTLFLTAYSHLDTQWRWTYPQVIREFLPNTFNQNLARIEKFPHYTFNFTGAGRYKLIKDYHPEAYEKIRAAVAAGRWFPNGNSWEENDTNLVSAESQIRQFLLGRQFFLREFGPAADSNEYMLPDCFGFPAALPSILAHCGIRGFSTQKLKNYGSAVGVPFNIGEWIGPDGNSVIAALNAGKYARPLDRDPARDPEWIDRLQSNGAATGIYADLIYLGTGDRGGAAKEPSVAFAEQGATSAAAPIRVLMARADLMFNSITDEQLRRLPKYQGDLLLTEHSAGCLTSQAYMKRWNRANELLADAAERASVAAWLLGAAPYPREKLNTAWQLLLRTQMHDILPGTALPKAYEYSWNDEVLCMNLFSEVLTNAVGAVASGMDTRDVAQAVEPASENPNGVPSYSPGLPESARATLGNDGKKSTTPTGLPPVAQAAEPARTSPPANTLYNERVWRPVPLIVYNPLSIDREDVVEATVTLHSEIVGDSNDAINGVQAYIGFRVYDGAGNEVPTQVLSVNRDEYHFVFLAKVPSVGFAVYFAKEGYIAGAPGKGETEQWEARAVSAAGLSVTPRTLENVRYRVTLNDAGDIASIHDKQQNRELLAAPARLAFLNETPAESPAWNMDWSDRQKPPRAYVGDDANSNVRIEIVERGPVRVALRVTREAQGSRIEQTVRLAAGGTGNGNANLLIGTTARSAAPEKANQEIGAPNSPADRIEIANTIDWRSKGCSLKAEFPLTVSNPLATYNEDLGKIQRGNNDPKKYEVPTHQWFDLTDTDGTHGVSILTAAKYGTDKPDDHTLRLTLLYTPAISEELLKKKWNYQEQRTQDWGRHDFTYGIYAHSGDWREGGTDWQALRMEQPLLAFTTTAHDGKLGRSHSLFGLNTSAVAVRAIKLAEDSDKIIVRLQELNGEPQTDVLFGAFGDNVTEVNGVEKVVDGFSWTDREWGTMRIVIIPLDFKKYQLRSLAFAMRKGSRPNRFFATSAPVTLPYNLNVFGYRGTAGGSNGAFDGAGSSIPAEMIPDTGTITSEGIAFAIGPRAKGKNEQNAVRCEGQTITLPEGDFNRVYLLAAALGGDTSGNFSVAGKDGAKLATTLTIQNWTGYIGSWDNRVFEGKVDELTHSVSNPLKRIDTGFIKRAPVAWYCDHRYDKNGKDMIYSYCYLFKYALDVPAAAGAKTVTLPNNPKIRILAMTAARDPAAGTRPARPLYDDFTDRKPIVIPVTARTAPAVRLSIVKQFPTPVIKQGDPGTADIKFGIEGGSVVKVGRAYHLIVSEIAGDPRAVKMRIAHWKSDDALHWQRQSTLYESSGDFTGADPRAALWASPVAFDKKSNRWNFFYVAYHSKPNDADGRWNINHLGRIWRAVSKTPGPDGIAGPYEDIGIILQPDADSQPWEGWQGVDSFHIFQTDTGWGAFYGSALTQTPREKQDPRYARWNVGLATAPDIAGPWKRVPGGPVMAYAENPIVTRLRNGHYLALFDSLLLDSMSIGYSDSPDGLHWSEPRTIRFQKSDTFWLRDARTPIGFIEEDDGTFTLIYTGYARSETHIPSPSDGDKRKSTYSCLGIARVKVEMTLENPPPPATP